MLAFPYVNGGLFADEDLEIPKLTQEIIDLILKKASEGFDWSLISPTIFGAVFESTLNPETRRSGGMHYTSVQNIHKVIDPLFLDDLKAELSAALELKVPATRNKRLEQFRAKLGKLTFLDPACGSGNFLTETYTSLRKLENEALRVLYEGQMAFGESFSPIQVHINQFYGIEINDFAVTVSRTALWIAESQMMKETEDIVGQSLDFLPLKSTAHIHEGNALRMDWNEVVPASQLDYIMGNPPFVGRRYRTKEQQEEVSNFFSYKDIDYVACWYKAAMLFIAGTPIHCAFVSSNSISQGEQVTPLWEEIFAHNGVINFAYSTFIWYNDSKDSAHVHVVIVGFSCIPYQKQRKLLFNVRQKFSKEGVTEEISVMSAKNINGYLLDAPSIFIKNRTKPLCDVPAMCNGNVPLDGDALKIEESDLPQFSSVPPAWIKRLIGGKELLYGNKRYVLWLVGADPGQINQFKVVKDRVEQCRNNRLNMKDKGTRKLANKPTTFRDTRNPESFIALPMVSGERREYIPLDFFNQDVIPTNQVQTIPDASILHFGVLTSSVHMAWMRTVAGRLKSDYRYSKDIVYNNFPWPNLTDKQKQKIEDTAQAILRARATHPESSLADLYDPLAMPEDLRQAHEKNDKAVKRAYGFSTSISEQEIVAELFKRYEERVKELEKETNDAKETAKAERAATVNRRKQKSV